MINRLEGLYLCLNRSDKEYFALFKDGYWWRRFADGTVARTEKPHKILHYLTIADTEGRSLEEKPELEVKIQTPATKQEADPVEKLSVSGITIKVPGSGSNRVYNLCTVCEHFKASNTSCAAGFEAIPHEGVAVNNACGKKHKINDTRATWVKLVRMLVRWKRSVGSGYLVQITYSDKRVVTVDRPAINRIVMTPTVEKLLAGRALD